MERPYYEELVRHSQNPGMLDEPVWSTFGSFYRKGTTNPDSKLFLGYGDFYPSVEEITAQIHHTGGIAFLAHPFQYRFQQIEAFMEQIYASAGLDGVECFHTTFDQKQMDWLTAFAEEHDLLICGGSDYHGRNKTKHDLGIGCGNLNIHSDILNAWPDNICRWEKRK